MTAKHQKQKGQGITSNETALNSKGIISKVKRQLTEWEKICVNHISDKRGTPKVCKVPLKLKSKKQITQLKISKNLSRRFFTDI